MHEEHLLQDLVARVDELARAEGGAPVVRVRFWVGALSHLTAATLRSKWPLAARGTLGEDAVVLVEASTDLDDPRAQSVVLTSFDVKDRSSPAER